MRPVARLDGERIVYDRCSRNQYSLRMMKKSCGSGMPEPDWGASELHVIHINADAAWFGPGRHRRNQIVAIDSSQWISVLFRLRMCE